jgi:hypothetical protein
MIPPKSMAKRMRVTVTEFTPGMVGVFGVNKLPAAVGADA